MMSSLDERTKIARLLTGRCNNCYEELGGYNVHGPGWNWLTPNFGPFCNDCFKEVEVRFSDWMSRFGGAQIESFWNYIQIGDIERCPYVPREPEYAAWMAKDDARLKAIGERRMNEQKEKETGPHS